MPLIEFEQFIEAAMLKRGRTYFNKGFVTQCGEINEGMYRAVVAGTKDYVVQLSLDNGTITESVCDCPYDLSSVCKHIVAVCFHLRQDGQDITKATTKSGGSRKSVKRKTNADQVSELLEKITHDELKQFVSEMAENDRSFRQNFQSTFAARGPGESKAYYAKQVKSILRSAPDRHGFIDPYTSGQVWSEVARLLDSAQKHLEIKSYTSAINICAAVLEQMTAALQYADDSNGSIGDCVRYAFDLLFSIANLPLPEDVRLNLIDYCFKAFDKEVFEGWDWHLQMLELASELLKTEEELQLLLGRIRKARRSDFEVEKAESITYQAFLRIRGEEEAETYLTQHLANPKLRRKAIEKSLDTKQYEKAREYALDGIELDRKAKPGLVMEWYNWLLKIAQAQNDRENIINISRLLFIDGFRHEQDYYDLMKQHLPADEWTDFVEGLIKDVDRKGRGYPAGRIADVYVREGWYARLLELIRDSPSLKELERYEPHLKKDYANDLAILYADAVVKYVRENIGRQHYKTAAKYLRRIKKLGAPEKANEIVEKLRVEYPQRRALQEELELV